MEDSRIVALYWARSENAIRETSLKYGKYCYAIACHILSDRRDAPPGPRNIAIPGTKEKCW